MDSELDQQYISPVYTSTLNRFQIGLGQLCKRP